MPRATQAHGRQEDHWREASIVRGVLVKRDTAFHYEYRPKQQPPVIGAPFHDDSLTGYDGVIDDWVDLEYDARLPEKIRRHPSARNLSTIYQRFLFAASFGSVFALAVAICLWKFLQAWYDKTHA